MQKKERSLLWSERLGSSDEMLGLVQTGTDRWGGASPLYPWGWVYGGRIAAQALRAAELSTPENFNPSTLHCNFLKPAHCDRVREHQIERLADSRRRATRSVTVSQSSAVVAHITATFDAPPSPEDDCVSDLELVPGDALEAARAGRFCAPAVNIGMFERQLLDLGPDRTAALITLDRPPATLKETACIIAYAADDLPSDAARRQFSDECYLEGDETALWSLTATYAMHFGVYKPGRTLLFDTRVKGVFSSRATIEGSVVDLESGRVVAICLQQVMVFKRKMSS